jgi:hypothetical protein
MQNLKVFKVNQFSAQCPIFNIKNMYIGDLGHLRKYINKAQRQSPGSPAGFQGAYKNRTSVVYSNACALCSAIPDPGAC